VKVIDRNFYPFPGKLERNCFTDSPAGACNQRNQILKFMVRHFGYFLSLNLEPAIFMKSYGKIG
jgi:hypothetical protein